MNMPVPSTAAVKVTLWQGLADVSHAQGQPEPAAQLLGVAGAVRKASQQQRRLRHRSPRGAIFNTRRREVDHGGGHSSDLRAGAPAST